MLCISLQRLPQHNKKRLFCETDRIFHFGFTKTFEPQETGIAFAAGETVRRRIVTTVGERKIDTEIDSFANDVGFGKFDERRVNLETSAFDPGFGSDIGQILERLDKFLSAIWIAAVVDCVY